MTDLPSAVRSRINCNGQFCLFTRDLISAALSLCDFCFKPAHACLRTALGVCSRHPPGKGLQMRIEYERACVEAGLPEERVKEIRRVFDAGSDLSECVHIKVLSLYCDHTVLAV